MKAPEKAIDPSIPKAQADADMAKFRGAAVTMGLGASTTAEFFDYTAAQVATHKPFTGTAEEGLQALRSVWGSRTAERLQAINSAIDDFDKHYPVKPLLRAWGLHNDPTLARMIWARLANRPK